jgi:hypothetical protein
VGAGSYLFQKIVVYGTGSEEGPSSSISGNHADGIFTFTGASYAAIVATSIGVYGSDVIGNHGSGVLAIQYTDHTYAALQNLTLAGNVIANNREHGAYAFNYSSSNFLTFQTVTSVGNIVSGTRARACSRSPSTCRSPAARADRPTAISSSSRS